MFTTLDPDLQVPASRFTEAAGKRPGTLLTPPPSSLPRSVPRTRSHEPQRADSGAPPGRLHERGGEREEEGAHSKITIPGAASLPGGREKRRENRSVTGRMGTSHTGSTFLGTPP